MFSDDDLCLIKTCILRRVVALENVYCRNVNVNRMYADYVAGIIATYVALIRKIEPDFELLTGSDSLRDFIKEDLSVSL